LQALVDKQKQVSTVGSSNLFNLSSQVLGMPEADQLDHNFTVFILIINENEIWDHHRISQKEHLAFTRELPVSSFISHLLLEFARDVRLKTAVESTKAFGTR